MIPWHKGNSALTASVGDCPQQSESETVFVRRWCSVVHVVWPVTAHLRSSRRSHSVWCLMCNLLSCSAWVCFSSWVTRTWRGTKTRLIEQSWKLWHFFIYFFKNRLIKKGDISNRYTDDSRSWCDSCTRYQSQSLWVSNWLLHKLGSAVNRSYCW